MVTAAEAADLLGVSVRTVERMRVDGILTPIYLPTTTGRGRARWFRRSEIDGLVQAARSAMTA